MSVNDNELREFFHQNRPQTADSGTFMAELNRKMDAMAEIKRIHDAGIRRYRTIALVALVAGILVGAGVITLLLLHPISVPHFENTLLAAAASFLSEWKMVVPGVIALAATILGLIPWGHATR